jgi:hypothetical protein
MLSRRFYIRNVLVIGSLHLEGKCDNIGVMGEEIGSYPPPCQFIAFRIRYYIISTFRSHTLIELQEIEIDTSNFGRRVECGPTKI